MMVIEQNPNEPMFFLFSHTMDTNHLLFTKVWLLDFQHPQFERTYKWISLAQVGFSKPSEKEVSGLTWTHVSVNWSYCSFRIVETKFYSSGIKRKNERGFLYLALHKDAYNSRIILSEHQWPSWLHFLWKADNLLGGKLVFKEFIRDQKGGENSRVNLYFSE